MMEIIRLVLSAALGAVGTLAALIWIPAKDQAELNLKHYDMALRILNDNVTCQVAIRQWAVNILNFHSPEPAKLPADAQKELVGKGCNSPEPAAVIPAPPVPVAQAQQIVAPQVALGGVVPQITALEGQGLKALIDKDLGRAAGHFAAAYRLWPVYRTTDEIQRYLRARSASPPRTDGEWKALYQSVAKCDLAGVDREMLNEFARAAGFGDSQAMAAQSDSAACAR